MAIAIQKTAVRMTLCLILNLVIRGVRHGLLVQWGEQVICETRFCDKNFTEEFCVKILAEEFSVNRL